MRRGLFQGVAAEKILIDKNFLFWEGNIRETLLYVNEN